MKDPIIKVCGMRDPQNIAEVSALGIDLMGFIFWPKSPRYVSQISSRTGIIPDCVNDNMLDGRKADVKYVRLVAKNMGRIPSWHKARGLKPWIMVDEVELEEVIK